MPHLLTSILKDRHWNAALISSLPNVRYLTGFTGSNALALALPEQIILFTDPRYTIQSKKEFHGRTVIVKGPLVAGMKRWLDKIPTLAFENERILFHTQQAVAAELPKRARMEGMGALLEELRMVKSAGEIAIIRRAVEINSAAFHAAMKLFRAGMTERELAAEIEYQMRQFGAEKPAFDTLVAFKQHSALPHAHPREAKIEGNGLLLIDMGAFWHGYASDMTRMAHLGTPSQKTKTHYKAVLEALTMAEASVRPGITAKKVDAVARKVLKSYGMEKLFTHSTGHGLGLEIHEPPRIGKKMDTVLCAGMTITIEPGVYMEGHQGVRIEDTILVTEQGSEIMTPTPKEMLLL